MSSSINNQLDFELEFLISKIANFDRNVVSWKDIIKTGVDSAEIIDIIKCYVERIKKTLDYDYFVEKYDLLREENEKLKEENFHLKEDLLEIDKNYKLFPRDPMDEDE